MFGRTLRLLLLITVTLSGKGFHNPITLGKDTGRHLFATSEKQRPLFCDEFITKEITHEDEPRKWLVAIHNTSFFAKTLEDTASFSGKPTTLHRQGFKKDPFEEYYNIMIEEDSPGLYEIYEKNRCSQKEPTCKSKVALDDIIHLRHGVSSSVRQLLQMSSPDPLFSYNNPLIKHNDTVFAVLGKIEGFRPITVPDREKNLNVDAYLVRYESHKQKITTTILEPNRKITVYGYDKRRNRYRQQKIQIPLQTLLDKKNVYKIKLKNEYKGLQNLGGVFIPSFTLAKSESGKSYIILYKAIEKMDKKGKPIFEQDITATTTRLKDLVSIKGISKTGCLQDASFSYLELLGRTLQEEGAYVQ